MLNTEFSPWPSYTEEEADAIKRVLLSNQANYWTGIEAREFEKELASWVGTEYAVAMSNGTVALEAALMALGIEEGEVITTSRTFVASAPSIVKARLVSVFADVDADSQNITVKTIRPVITSKTKAIVCVHLAGWPCDMDDIMKLAREYNLYVIEDCAQAHGAYYKSRSIGSLGHLAAWSFCQNKIITTGGEGDMVTTNSTKFRNWIWSYKDHGKSWSAIYEKKHRLEFKWVHEHFGSNCRMTEIQAVLGRIQLGLIKIWSGMRLNNANQIWRTAAQIKSLRVSKIAQDIIHAAYKCYIFVKESELAPGWNTVEIIKKINEYGGPCSTGSCPEIYLEKAFDNIGFRPPERLPVARDSGEKSLMLLVHPTLTEAEIKKTCSVLRKVMSIATDSNHLLNRGRQLCAV